MYFVLVYNINIMLYDIQFCRSPLYAACSNGHDKIVQLLLKHGIQVDILEQVSYIPCIHVKLCSTTEV